MRVLLDEQLPRHLARELRGHDVITENPITGSSKRLRGEARDEESKEQSAKSQEREPFALRA